MDTNSIRNLFLQWKFIDSSVLWRSSKSAIGDTALLDFWSMLEIETIVYYAIDSTHATSIPSRRASTLLPLPTEARWPA